MGQSESIEYDAVCLIFSQGNLLLSFIPLLDPTHLGHHASPCNDIRLAFRLCLFLQGNNSIQ